MTRQSDLHLADLLSPAIAGSPDHRYKLPVGHSHDRIALGKALTELVLAGPMSANNLPFSGSKRFYHCLPGHASPAAFHYTLDVREARHRGIAGRRQRGQWAAPPLRLLRRLAKEIYR